MRLHRPLAILALALAAAGCGQRNWLSWRDVRAAREPGDRVAVTATRVCRWGGLGNSCGPAGMGPQLCAVATWRPARQPGARPSGETVDAVEVCQTNRLGRESGSATFELRSSIAIPRGGLEIELDLRAPGATDVWQFEEAATIRSP